MVRLSVNLNKIATVRNARGGTVPSVLDAMDVCIDAGVRSITLHQRADERHIRRSDVYEVAAHLRPDIELNLEGDPRPDWIELVHEVRPAQVTLVPVRPGEITSEAGWGADVDLRATIAAMRERGIRVSAFIDPTIAAVSWASAMGADRVELYTEPFARAFEHGLAAARASFDGYVAVAKAAHAQGLGVNAGHDLDLDNLVMFRELPHLDEVSIGHALISRALFVGLGRVVAEYLDVLRVSG